MSEAGLPSECDICGVGFTYNPDVLNTYIHRYNMLVCPSCWRGNHDGWSPIYNNKFEEHLAKNNIPLPEPNAQGLYPRS